MSYREFEKLDISDTEADLFASPSKSPRPSRQQPSRHQESSNTGNGDSQYDAEAARDATLRKELDSLRHTNTVIEDLISSLSVAKSNMSTVSSTVNSASTLLQTWTRILSQTEHNQRLLLNPEWKGASQDMIDAENEVVMRKQAAERRAAEEARRREEARIKAENEERARAAGTATVSRGGTRGRGRARVQSSGYGRITPGTTSSGYVGVGGQTGLGRTSSQIGRGTSSSSRGVRGSTRGSTRGVR